MVLDRQEASFMQKRE